jgi:uncharacterized membrane protein
LLLTAYGLKIGLQKERGFTMKTRFEDTTVKKRRAAQVTQPALKSGKGEKLKKSLTINRPASELYAFWRHLENLPRFMVHLKSVTERGNGTSHWIIETSKGKELEWDARIIEDRPNEMISWQSLEGADVENAGSVWFTPAPSGRGTVVRVSMKYSPPGGKVGAILAKLTGQGAEKELAEDLFRFKALMETGEVPTTQGQPNGGKE